MKKLEINFNINTATGSAKKMNPDELQMFMHFKKRGAVVPAKKGKGSYDRKKLKKVYTQGFTRNPLFFYFTFGNALLRPGFSIQFLKRPVFHFIF